MIQKKLNLFLIVIFFLLIKYDVNAQIKSPQYQILQPAIDIDNQDQYIHTTLNSTELATLLKQGYLVKNEEKPALRVTLSDTTLTFSNQAGQVDNVSTVLTVTNSSESKYLATIQALTTLKTVWGDEIPSTQCDQKCTINIARPWESVERLGFGYTLKGDGIPGDFKNISYFKPLPIRSKQDEPVNIMYGRINKTTKQETIIFRINNSNKQPEGTYQTIVNTNITVF